MVLEGVSVDVKDKLTHLTLFLIKIYSSFDAADFVGKNDRVYRSGLAEGFASVLEVSLVEGDIYGSTLGKVLGKKRVLYPFDEEFKSVRPDNIRSRP